MTKTFHLMLLRFIYIMIGFQLIYASKMCILPLQLQVSIQTASGAYITLNLKFKLMR